MVIVRFYGGLGNQLFQYAAARQLSLRLNTELIYDVSEFSKVKITGASRKFELDNFNISGRSPKPKEAFACKFYNNRIIRLFLRCWPWLLFRDRHLYKFNSNFKRISGDIYLDGYWQSYRYFEEIRSVLISDLTSIVSVSNIEKIWMDEIKNSNSISIHIRRGDYIENSKVANHHGSCSLDYYIKAAEIIANKVCEPVFYIFSDDMKWAKENIKFTKEIRFVDFQNSNFSPCHDLLLMSSCKHQIIANSSFSWWAGWLNCNEEKIVICPKKWIKSKDFDYSDLIPTNWLAI
jgi:hypothetical protein